MTYEIDKKEYAALWRGIKTLPKEANKELRQTSKEISQDIVIPIIQQAMDETMSPKIADRMKASVRVKSDRIPAVKIGYKKKVFSGGASSIFMRFGTVKGIAYTSRTGNQVKWPEALTSGGYWTKIASDRYLEPGYNAWRKAVIDIIDKWNRGK